MLRLTSIVRQSMNHEYCIAYSQFLHSFFNSLPNDKILDFTTLKTLAENEISVTEKLKFVLYGVENIVGKGENACYQYFLLFPQYFQKASSLQVVKSQDCVVKK